MAGTSTQVRTKPDRQIDEFTRGYLEYALTSGDNWIPMLPPRAMTIAMLSPATLDHLTTVCMLFQQRHGNALASLYDDGDYTPYEAGRDYRRSLARWGHPGGHPLENYSDGTPAFEQMLREVRNTGAPMLEIDRNGVVYLDYYR